jgi:IS30 family transposase
MAFHKTVQIACKLRTMHPDDPTRLITDLSTIGQTELNDVARLMNQRPRKTLGWKTPEEAMAEELAAFRSNVALEN